MDKIILGFLILLMVSCNTNKKYKYIETTKSTSLGGRPEIKDEEKVIEMQSDSAAYLEGFELFCISIQVQKDIMQGGGTPTEVPLKFKVLDENGKDITGLKFRTKAIREKEIMELVFKDRSIEEEPAKVIKIDSLKIGELEKFFRIKKDEFSNENKAFYEPKSAPQFVNKNVIYCYFQVVNKRPTNLRFRMQYYADEWLFFDRVQFSIDGKAFEYVPSKTETDSGNGGYIWEWFDESVTTSDTELLNALSNAKSAKMKVIGKQYYDVKELTKEQIKGIKNTLDLYKAMGGEY